MLRQGQFRLRIYGVKNISDQLTKYVSNEDIMYHMRETGQTLAQGRHESMPEVA